MHLKLGGARNIQITLVWIFTIVYLIVTIYLKLACYYVSILPLPMALTYVFYEEKVKAFISRHDKVVWFAVMLMALVIMGYAVAGQYGMRLPGWGLPVYTFVPCVIVYITYYLGGWKNKVTNFLGRISYEFYIVHGFIVMQMGRVHVFGLTGYAYAMLVIFIVLGLTVTFAWLLSQICDIFNSKLFVGFKFKNK